MLKAKKAKPKSKSSKKSLKKKLTDICRALVRERDKNRCQRCGKPCDKHNAHLSHVLTKKAFPHLEFDLNNLKLLCYYCHIQFWHKEPMLAKDWFANKFPERWEYLQSEKNNIVKVNEVWLQGQINLMS